MSYEEAPLDVRRPGQEDNWLHMSVGTFSVLEWILKGVLPLLLLGWYIYLWLRRRGR